MTRALSVAESVVDDPKTDNSPQPRRLAGVPGRVLLADAEITIPVEVRDGLARAAAAQGLSVTSYLTRLAWPFLTEQGRAAQGARARQCLKEWNGYDPTDEELAEVDADLDGQLDRIRSSRRHGRRGASRAPAELLNRRVWI